MAASTSSTTTGTKIHLSQGASASRAGSSSGGSRASSEIRPSSGLDVVSRKHVSRLTGLQQSPLERRRRRKTALLCSASTEQFTSPKTGAVGVERFKLDAVPGTYWGPAQAPGERVTLHMDTGSEVIETSAHVGENLLRVAEAAGAMVPDEDFCFEGTCSKCEMEVEGGAKEVGYRAEPGSLDVVRSCLCPVPGGRPERTIKMLNEADIWGDGVL